MPISFFKSKAAERPVADDPLAQFDAEGDAGKETVSSAAAIEVSSRALSLEAVLMRSVPVFWPEAVAVLEATCGQLTGSAAPDSPVPGPADIFITREGTVLVRAGSGRGESVQRLARTMHSLTSGQAIPAQLRLFVTKWIEIEGGRTIAEFAGELAYFARPNGAQLIRELYARVAQSAPVKPASTKKPAPVAQPNFAKWPGAKPRRAWLSVAAALGLLLTVALIFLPGGGEDDDSSPSWSAGLVQRVTEFAGTLGEVRLEVGDIQARLNEHLTADVETTGRGGSSAAPAANRGRSGAAVSGGSAAQAAGRLASVRTAPPLNVTPAASAASPAAPEPPVAGVAVPLPEIVSSVAVVPAPVVPTDTIYSSGDEDVAPPRMLAPQLPPGPLVLGGSEDRNVMEIIVGGDGSVERVKLLTPARRMTDMMLLSGAKTWKFTPASKDGHTVRYRMAVSWAP